MSYETRELDHYKKQFDTLSLECIEKYLPNDVKVKTYTSLDMLFNTYKNGTAVLLGCIYANEFLNQGKVYAIEYCVNDTELVYQVKILNDELNCKYYLWDSIVKDKNSFNEIRRKYFTAYNEVLELEKAKKEVLEIMKEWDLDDYLELIKDWRR
jgi:hypothetical protein